MQTIRKSLWAWMLWLACSMLALAQGTKDSLTTMGTTVTRDGKTHAYLLWQPGEAASTVGMRFGIYAKTGNAQSSDPYQRIGLQTLQTSVNTIRAMLELGLQIDQSGATMVERIDGIYQEVILRPGQAPTAAADATLDAAGKLHFLIQSALTDPQIMGRLFLLGRAHPGVMQALGHAYQVPIASTGVRTYEIREINLDLSDARVIGRVTLDPENPLVLSAPSSPVQVRHDVDPKSQYRVNPKDHLNVRLRWGVDSPLRDRLPHTFGFDVFRVKKAEAETWGWHTTPPDADDVLAALDGMVANDPSPVIARVNQMPILPSPLLTTAEAIVAGQPDSFYCSDDGVWFTGAEGKKIRRPYVDGEQYYYFVAARTIVGAPGEISIGSLVTMCDRQPPRPPTVFSATSTYVAPLNQVQREQQNFPQFLRVKIRQLLDANGAELSSDAAPNGYYVYRWSRPDEHLANPGNPVLGRIGYVAHVPGNTFVTFDDNGTGAPSTATHLNKAVWYTVRAVGKSACVDEILSGQSAAVAGYLRDFKAPPGPTGDFLVCRYVPEANGVGRSSKTPADLGLPAGYKGIAVHVFRQSPMIRAAEIEVAIRRDDQSWMVIYQRELGYRTSNYLKAYIPYPEPKSKQGGVRVGVRAIAINGAVSAWDYLTNDGQAYDLSLYEFEVNATKSCESVTTAFPPTHISSDPDGHVNAIDGGLTLPAGQGVSEWRVYRRVGADGALSLIKKGEGSSLPAAVTWQDDSPPAVQARVCYYGQVLDQNANPSPLIPLGCVEMITPTLPTPMMSPVTLMTDDGTNARMKLNWFCDPAGVERFEVFVADSSGQEVEIGGLSERLQDLPLTGLSSDYPDDSFYVYQTNRLQGALGSGPNFTVEITVPADQTLYFAVRACGQGDYPRMAGNLSNVVEGHWQTPTTGVQPVIPWPARPLPATYDHRREIGTYAKGEGPIWPLVMPTFYPSSATGILIGLTHFTVERSKNGDYAQCSTTTEPKQWLFQVRERDDDMSSLQELMPFMLYRHQVSSTQHPTAKPNLVQCTPLIDRISWKKINNVYHVRDPFFTFQPLPNQAPVTFPIPVSGAWTDAIAPTLGAPGISGAPRPEYLRDATGLIFLKDPLPVIAGAKYRHVIVCFTEDGEIRRVIPLTPLQH